MARVLGVAALIVICGCGPSQETKSAILRHDLLEMRKAIRDFQLDKHRPPQNLNELVSAHYLAAIPRDPITGAADWGEVTEQPVRVDDFSSGAPPPSAASGVVDVHSTAPGHDANGKPWSEY